MPARLLCLPSARRVYNTDVRPSSPTMTIDTSHEQTSYSPNQDFYATFHRHNAFGENGDRKGRNIRRHS